MGESSTSLAAVNNKKKIFVMQMEVDFQYDLRHGGNANEETLLSEDNDIESEDDSYVEESFEDRYLKIQKEMESNLKQEEPPRKLYKVKLNDFLYSKHYSQLKKAALDGSILKLKDINKMLKGEKVNQEKCTKDSKTFLKKRKDDQLLRDLCSTEMFLKENITSNKNGHQIKKESIQEHLLEEW